MLEPDLHHLTGLDLTAALADRVTHKAHIIEVNGESYRFRETLRRQEALKHHPETP